MNDLRCSCTVSLPGNVFHESQLSDYGFFGEAKDVVSGKTAFNKSDEVHNIP